MAKFQDKLNQSLKDFILEQKMFFNASAPNEGRVNVSPKGTDSFRILDDNTVAYLDLTGSGNETSAHIQQNERVTIMFCSYSEMPLILRLYGKGEVVKNGTPRWDALMNNFPRCDGERQIIVLHIDSVQTSCGFGVPVYDYVGEKKASSKLLNWESPFPKEEYWKAKNQNSIDGLPTYILE